MSDPDGSAFAAPGSLPGRIAWHWRHNPKIELWIAWWTMVVFYQLYGLIFFLVTRTQPPPEPWWDQEQIVQWFDVNRSGILIGFAVVFVVSGMTSIMNALIAYSIRRMSVSRAFAHAYLVLYGLSTLPGFLFMAIGLTVAAMRPARDPRLISWLYDFGFMTFEGTMGVFLVGPLLWMTAILIDRNRVFPKWFGYFNLCNALTEVVVAIIWLVKDGWIFGWSGAITFWIQVAVFGTYTGVFITLLRQLILREDFGTGPLPERATRGPAEQPGPRGEAA